MLILFVRAQARLGRGHVRAHGQDKDQTASVALSAKSIRIKTPPPQTHHHRDELLCLIIFSMYFVVTTSFERPSTLYL